MSCRCPGSVRHKEQIIRSSGRNLLQQRQLPHWHQSWSVLLVECQVVVASNRQSIPRAREEWIVQSVNSLGQSTGGILPKAQREHSLVERSSVLSLRCWLSSSRRQLVHEPQVACCLFRIESAA